MKLRLRLFHAMMIYRAQYRSLMKQQQASLVRTVRLSVFSFTPRLFRGGWLRFLFLYRVFLLVLLLLLLLLLLL